MEQTDTAAVYLTEIGKSRVVYFPWDIERSFWKILNVDHLSLLTNAITWAMNEKQPVSVIGKGLLDITIWQQKKSLTVHLVNLTNPMMLKGPFREYFPISEQRVEIQLPAGVQVEKVTLLVSEMTPETERTPESIIVTVPLVNDREVIAIDFD
jgi:hypothetical protein